MTSPSGITGPQDLAETVRNAVDPLENHPPYGTATSARDGEQSRADEMKQLLEERSLSGTDLVAACEDYIKEHPTRSIVMAATAGAACTALLFAVADMLRAER
jgi:ElaB/YqjD/DUF883 family membrane-anchored ribosome-binding protein